MRHNISLTGLDGLRITAASMPASDGNYVTFTLNDHDGNHLAFTGKDDEVAEFLDRVEAAVANATAIPDWRHPDADPDMPSGCITGDDHK